MSHNFLLWKAISNSHKVLDRPRKSSHPFRPFLTFRQVSGRVLEYLPPAGCSLGAAIQDVGATAHPRASLEPCTYGLPIGSVAFATVIPGLGRQSLIRQQCRDPLLRRGKGPVANSGIGPQAARWTDASAARQGRHPSWGPSELETTKSAAMPDEPSTPEICDSPARSVSLIEQ